MKMINRYNSPKRLFLYWGECLQKNKYWIKPYLVNDNKVHPVAIICPGGGYRMVCNHMEGKPIAEYLNSQGIHAVVLHYRVKSKAEFPNPILDIVHCLEDLKIKEKEWRLDLSNYSIWGFSAGGHMAALFGTDKYGFSAYDLPKPSALVLVYPVITIDKNQTHIGTRRHFTNYGKNKKAIEAGNVYNFVTKDYPDTFIWRGDIDKSVPHISSDLMIEQLEKNNIRHIGIKYKDVPHGVGLGLETSAEGWADQAINFWLKK